MSQMQAPNTARLREGEGIARALPNETPSFSTESASSDSSLRERFTPRPLGEIRATREVEPAHEFGRKVFNLPGGVRLELQLPSAEQLLSAPCSTLVELVKQNHAALQECVGVLRESIPFFGLQGTTKERMDLIFATQSIKEGCFGCIKERAAQPAQLLEDLLAVAGDANSYSEREWERRKGTPVEPGGILVADLSSRATAVLGRLPGADLRGNSRFPGAELEPCFKAETGARIDPADFDRKVLGVVPPELIAALDVAGKTSQYDRIILSARLKQHVIVARALELFGSLTE